MTFDLDSAAPVFIGHEIYRHSSYGHMHPLRIPRVSTVMDLSRALGWLGPANFRTAPRAKPEALTHWHSADYLQALQIAERDGAVSDRTRERHQIGTHTNPVFPEIWRRPATTAGGSLLAGELVSQGRYVYHPAGGTHHAFPDRAGGFCYLNDPVLAMLSLRRNGLRRLAYIDIDAHHPDGVEHGFGNDPDCLMISVHEARRWPFTGQITDRGVGNVYNLPLPRGLNDSEMALVRDDLMLPLVQAWQPDAIILQCGADAVEEDPLSRLSLSNNAHWAILAQLMSLAPRLLVLGGGGYNPWSVGRLWTGIWGVLNRQDIPDRLPAEAEGVLRALTFPGNSRGRNPPDHWFTTLRDAPRHGPVREEVRGAVQALQARKMAWA
ncbi:acetoin utilization protein AcuC [Aliishimia ponticola]|uniref:Acetoin utilization protein AcuC n=1 Tax=Aliishimia ponticola TaxID=2499833 RepID=A0A4S4N8G5_9RHOB|nr:acetoin utilization protein AcuC [Aliishimia ponticola]THH35419.1 acetoin utilization protein AcuC [Aliishimia ponticola]